MSITTVLAVPVLVALAANLGYGLSLLRPSSQPRGRRSSTSHSEVSRMDSVPCACLTLILAERQVFPSLWLQLLLLTFTPLAVGFIAGRFTSEKVTVRSAGGTPSVEPGLGVGCWFSSEPTTDS